MPAGPFFPNISPNIPKATERPPFFVSGKGAEAEAAPESSAAQAI